MEPKKIKKIIECFNIGILFLSIMLLVLNLKMITIKYSYSGELPVITYESYSSLEISSIFILLILFVFKIFSRELNLMKSIRSYVNLLVPIILLIFMFLFIFNPHSLVLIPTNRPPAYLHNIEIGGIIYLILSISVILSNIILAYIEGILRKHLIISVIIVGAFLISDFIHESGHAFFILLSGGKITEFYPFPVLLGGEFNAGYVGFTNVPSNLKPLVILGGEIFQWILLGTLTTLLFIRSKHKLNLLFTILLIIAIFDFPLYTINNSIDLPHWFIIGSTQGDIMIFTRLTGIPLWVMIIIALMQLLLGLLLIYYKIFKRSYKHPVGEQVKSGPISH